MDQYRQDEPPLLLIAKKVSAGKRQEIAVDEER